MNYLNQRLVNFNKFQEILDNEKSENCGDQLQLQLADGDDQSIILPTLRFLGSGAYGLAFSLEHQELASRNINIVAKISKSTIRQNVLETGYGLAITKIVERGDSPNLPLFAYCKGARNKENCICVKNCEFQNTINGIVSSHDRDKLENIMKNKCYISFAEKLDGDAHHFFMSMCGRETEETVAKHLFSCLAQLMFGLKELSKYGLAHTDMHGANILIKQRICNDRNATPYLNYQYDGHTFSVAHMDTLCVIWDFGFISKKGKTLEQLNFTENFMKQVFNGEHKNWRQWKTSVLYDVARFMMNILAIISLHEARYPMIFDFCNRVFIELTSLLQDLELQDDDDATDKLNNPIHYVRRLFVSMFSNAQMGQWWNEVVKIDAAINPDQVLASYPSHIERDNEIAQSIDLLEDEGISPVVPWNVRLEQQAAHVKRLQQELLYAQQQMQQMQQMQQGFQSVVLVQPPQQSVVQATLPPRQSLIQPRQSLIPQQQSVVQATWPQQQSVVQATWPQQQSIVEAQPQQSLMPPRQSLIQPRQSLIPPQQSIVQATWPQQQSIVEAQPQQSFGKKRTKRNNKRRKQKRTKRNNKRRY
jgi:hypothetical protein